MKPILLSLSLFALVVGASAATPREIAVKSGDTLIGIARTHLGDAKRWREIAGLNGLQPPYTLEVGETLLLPVEDDPASAAGEPSPDTAARLALAGATTGTIAPEALDSGGEPGGDAASRVAMERTALPEPPSPVSTSISFATAPAFVPVFTEPLEQLLGALRTRNPSIRAAEEAARAASYRPSQAGSLPDPMLRAAVRFDPQREVMVDNGMASVREKTMVMPMFQVSQMIPVGKLGPMRDMESRMARAKSEMTGLERAMQETRLKAAYADLLYVDRAARTLVRIREILKLLVSSTEAMYRVGSAKQSDLLRAHLEISMISDRLLMLEGRRRELASTINALVDRPDSMAVGTPEALESFALDESSLVDSSPAVKVAQAEVEAAKARVAVAKAMFVPDVELMGGTMIQRDLDPRLEFGVGITLPVWSASKQSQGLKEAEARLAESVERLRGAKADVRGRIAAALAMGRAARAQAELYGGTIIPQARLTLDASLSHYRVGQVDFMTVVENTTTVMNYEIARDEAVAGFYRSVAMIEEASGATLTWKRAAAGGER